jgi:hypothetical protein
MASRRPGRTLSLNLPDGGAIVRVWIRDRFVCASFTGRDGKALLVLSPEGARNLIAMLEANVEAIEQGRQNFLHYDG